MIFAIWRVHIFFRRKAERLVLMMALFFAQRVILGKTDFSEVPRALQNACAEILIDSGLPELVPDVLDGTASE
jgi:hypothetical protein